MIKMNDKLDFEQIVKYCSKHAPISDVYEKLHHKTTMYKGNKQENVSCPWHGTRGDLRGSATLYPDTNCFYCHACSSKPLNVVDFVVKYLGKTFFEAIFWLEKDFNFKIPKEILDFKESIETYYTKENFLQLVKVFEDYIINKKSFFNFQQYKKIFHLLDAMTFQVRKKENINLKQYFNKFEQLKIKINMLIEQKLRDLYGKEENI